MQYNALPILNYSGPKVMIPRFFERTKPNFRNCPKVGLSRDQPVLSLSKSYFQKNRVNFFFSPQLSYHSSWEPQFSSWNWIGGATFCIRWSQLSHLEALGYPASCSSI
jgi:hypothetical protein